ncbi:SRR1-like protein [Agrilus planipennis]|uniref:SRR1-like protein n=1 Tax=Agrilus planipennis TaxID=224129 RepID=A0A1W4WWV3_AGRPL|nr:SRR1-like protein [Agrilus planipennis]
MSTSMDSNLINSEFILVKNKKLRKNKTIKPNNLSQVSHFENNTIDSIIRRIKSAKQEIIVSDFYKSVKASTREALSLLIPLKPTEIVCFGLGKVGECTSARYQLALLLCLKDFFDVKACIYDPVFTSNDVDILKHFNCLVLSNNSEAKYRISSSESLTLFYLPHCPKQLSNNLLWANWGLELNCCIIIANSFTKILETNPSRILQGSANFISKIVPYTLELALINTFKYQDIFNDLSLHIFPNTKLYLISKEFWEDRDEPKYTDNDIEFITKEMADSLKL